MTAMPRPMHDGPVRVLLVDDEPLARAGLRAMLRDEPDVVVVGESGSGSDAVTSIERLTPDVVFLDIALPDADGFDVMARIPRDAARRSTCLTPPAPGPSHSRSMAECS